MSSLVTTGLSPELTLGGYSPSAGAFDEMMDAGGLRPHWRRFLELLGGLGPAEIARRWEKAQHLIHENGVSHNVYGDPQGMERPWRLSPVPVLLPAAEWPGIAAALAQRARLLGALLADLYGPQRSLLEGRLPPALVYAHPGFLRAVHGTTLSPAAWLPLYAADLIRASDGRFHVLEDRTMAPTGAGYALENRIVISSTLPEIFRECNVERLAFFFRTLREGLQALAPHNRDNPRIVLMTPGPYNATYFEQAYLAQYLGFTLVTGGDLVVRDDRVHLKTLGGLLQVDVIVRRVNDDYCDPLELRGDSMLGVPGLVQAARAGNVAIANPLGTTLVQTPAFLPYLPGVCRQLLGEELVLPSVKTWWCGEPAAMEEALGRFEGLVIKPALAEGPVQPIFTASLTADERAGLAGRIRANPTKYVAQEYVAPSQTPSLVNGAIASRGMVLRCYAVSTPRGEHRVMPGGLARVATQSAATEVSIRLGAGSKDVWVLSNETVSNFSLLPPSHRPVDLSRGGGDLPSRAADHLFWLGRYAERAESVARLARVIGTRLADLAGEGDLAQSSEFGPLLGALTAQTEFLYSVDIPVDVATSLEACESRLLRAVSDAALPGSLISVLKGTLRAGGIVRDRISLDMWRLLVALGEDVTELEHMQGADRLSTLAERLNRVVIGLSGFSGLAMDSMSRGQAWHFLDVGRRIERAVNLVTLLRATTARSGDREWTLLEAVLEVADSAMTYRRRYLTTLQTAPVVDLLLTDDTNPRSVLFQLRALADHIRALPLLPGAGVKNPQLRSTLEALAKVELADPEALCAVDGAGARPALEVMLRELGTLLPALSDSLSHSYLNHAAVSRHLFRDEVVASGAPGVGGDV